MDARTLEAQLAPLLRELTRENVRALREALTDPDGQAEPWLLSAKRWTPAKVPGVERVWEQVAAAFAPLLESDQPMLRTLGLIVLQYAPAPGAIPRVLPLAEDSDPLVAAPALHALAELGAAEGVPLAVGRLHDPSHEVRVAAATALGRVGQALHVALLAERLANDPSPMVRSTAAHALGALADKGGLQHLLATLRQDLHPAVWAGVRQGLWTAGPAAINALTKLAKDESADARTRVRACEGLAKIDTFEVHLTLRGLMKSHPDDSLGYAAAWALEQRGEPSGGIHLASRLRTGTPRQRAEVAARLASTDDSVALPRLLEHYFDPAMQDIVQETLALLPAERRAALPRLADDINATVGRAALDLLGVYGAAEYADALAQIAQVAEPDRALTAAVSLARLDPVRGEAALTSVLTRYRGAAERSRARDLIEAHWQPLPDGVRAIAEALG